MHPGRLERFTDEFPGTPIPWHEELPPDKSKEILDQLDQSLPGTDDGLYIPDVDPEFLSLHEFLQLHGIEPQETVFLNYFEGSIDRMRLVDLDKGFDAFYWIGPDDLQIFDATFRWAIFIDHDGRVHVKKR